MGHCLGKNKEPERIYTIAILGLDNAGKTVTAKSLQGDPPDLVTPTLGFSNIEFKLDKFKVTMFDLGGGKRIRGIWNTYLSEIYGVIYVVDSTDSERLHECREVLKQLLENPKISGKPVLLLANKQDCQGALDEIEICETLNLEGLVNINKCPCRVETCSAVLGHGKKLDPSIFAGVRWLLNTVQINWEKLDARVHADIAEKKEKTRKEREQKMERLRIQREEKEKNKREKGYDSEEEEDQNDGPVDVDPFKAVSVADLEKKEQQLKEKKMKRKMKDKQILDASNLNQNADLSDNENNTGSMTTRSLDSPRLRRPKKGQQLDSSSHSPPFSRASESRNGYGRFHNGGDEAGVMNPSFNRPLPWQRRQSPRPESPSVPSMSPHLSRRSFDALGLEAGGRRLAPALKLEPLETFEKKPKKKKKAKKNQTGPLETDFSGRTDESDDHRTWEPSSRPMYKASKSPRLDPLQEPESESESFSARWGLAEDLEAQPMQRNGPNSEYEDIVT